ncbi:MAG: DUF4386 domain-containing protein [Opitutae bacterium]|nr:DUF4386 domain-containing protein [Opitutae bacterium]
MPGPTSLKSTARRAGFVYLLILFLAPLNLIYFPSVFIVPGNATATALKITSGELLYRAGIFLGLLDSIAFLFLVSCLYELFKEVDRARARLMVLLVAVGVAVSIVNLLNLIAPLILLSGADFLAVFTKPQLDALALGFLRLRSNGNNVAMAFWALWLFPFGLLVIKSGFIPKLLGSLLIVGGFAYLAVSFTSIVFPAYRPVVDRIALPFYAIGELAMIFWLLVIGVKAQELKPPTDADSTKSAHFD